MSVARAWRHCRGQGVPERRRDEGSHVEAQREGRFGGNRGRAAVGSIPRNTRPLVQTCRRTAEERIELDLGAF